MRTIKQLMLGLGLILMLTGLSACNTVQGAGMDVANVGNAVVDVTTPY